MAEKAPKSLQGKTVRWTFDEGPTQGTTYEHRFGDDGTVVWSVVKGEGEGKSGPETKCAVERVTPDVHVVSYLSESGYTLTAVLSFADMSVLSFASNEKQWFQAKGSFEIVE